MKNSHCLSPVELTKALSACHGDQNAQLPAHVATCAKCLENWKTQKEIVELAKALPQDEISKESSNNAFWNIRHQLSRSEDKRGPERRKWVLALAAAVFLGAAVVAFFSLKTAVPKNLDEQPRVVKAQRGKIHGSDKADYRVLSAQPDEIVRLFDGTITVTVAHLNLGERFRVVTGDAEIEVVGTAFDVVVKDDSLMAVRVIKGVVDVRRSGAEPVRLQKGEAWKPQIEPLKVPDKAEHPDGAQAKRSDCKDKTPSIVKKNGPQAADGKKKEVKTVTVPDAEACFARGWRLLRQKQYQAAAAEFRLALSAPNAGGIDEDATYWLGVALERSGDADAAETAYRNYLKKYPSGDMAEEVTQWMNRK